MNAKGKYNASRQFTEPEFLEFLGGFAPDAVILTNFDRGSYTISVTFQKAMRGVRSCTVYFSTRADVAAFLSLFVMNLPQKSRQVIEKFESFPGPVQ